jgi:hypothetical protein
MKRYNILTKRTYEKDGQEKAQWLRVGTLTQFQATEQKDESFIMELNLFPHTRFFVLEQKKKEDKPGEEKSEVEGEEVNAEEIPF